MVKEVVAKYLVRDLAVSVLARPVLPLSPVQDAVSGDQGVNDESDS